MEGASHILYLSDTERPKNPYVRERVLAAISSRIYRTHILARYSRNIAMLGIWRKKASLPPAIPCNIKQKTNIAQCSNSNRPSSKSDLSRFRLRPCPINQWLSFPRRKVYALTLSCPHVCTKRISRQVMIRSERGRGRQKKGQMHIQ